MDGVELKFTDEALDYVVDKALEYKLGARGLRSLCEAILTDPMYELPSSNEDNFVIDKHFAESALNKNLMNRLELAN